jgi:hypothetical protein
MTTHQTTRCMTVFRVGEVVSVEFPFTDMQGRKRRPGVVLASDAKDLLLARITTHEPRHPFDVPLQDWAAIGLPKPSTARHASRILGGSPARRPPSTSPSGDYDLMLRGVITQAPWGVVNGLRERPFHDEGNSRIGAPSNHAGRALPCRTDWRIAARAARGGQARIALTTVPCTSASRKSRPRGRTGRAAWRRQNDSGFSGVSTGSASGLDRCAPRGLLAGGGIPQVVYGGSRLPSARRSAHGRCTLRISRAAPPPAACRPGTTPPLRASPPREDSAPQDHLREHRELA